MRGRNREGAEMKSKLKCSACGHPFNGGIESLGIHVCQRCRAKTNDGGHALMGAIVRDRGFIDDDGKPTAKALAMFDRIYDEEGNVRPHGTCDA